MRVAVFATSVFGLVACDALPRSGPNKAEIFAGSVQQEGDAFVVAVSDTVTRQTALVPALGFSSSFTKAGVVGSDTIAPGDVLGVSIYENVDEGIFTTTDGAPAALTDVQVDGAGFIFIPYAGRIKAAGNSPETVRRIITRKLEGQTPDPQVMVVRAAGNGSTVSVTGAIGGQGVYPIERPTRTLSAMLARAGGIAVRPEVAVVRVRRGAKTGQIWYKDLFENPKLDIALRNGDKILVEEDTRAFTALGATGAQTRMTFDSQTLSALEAIAQVGGLSAATADPTGVFIFRNEPAEIANPVLGRTDLVGDQRMIYVLDLTEPNGMFRARDFLIRDGDTVYVTEAPFVQWTKVLGALTSTTGAANSLTSAATNGLGLIRTP
ncbi:MAG: sugar ABC transporter substrate-binding protein [Rhodobacterales bacterium]|nr:MAG: sugar ABC transporter substrate-binding protein [Rhodobacterales bacterium]